MMGKRGVSAFAVGIAAPFRGLAFLNAHPKLWSWVIAPLVVNLLLCGSMVWLMAGQLDSWIPDMTEAWPAWIDWLRVGLGWVIGFAVWSVALGAAAILTVVLSGLVNSPFYDLLSEKVEAAHFGRKDPGRPLAAMLGDIVRSLGTSLSLLLRYVAVMAVLLLLSFVGIGAPLFMIAGWYYAGLAQIDLTLARKLYPAGKRTGWARGHLALVLGLGVPVAFLPPLLPFGIVGATLTYLEEPAK